MKGLKILLAVIGLFILTNIGMFLYNPILSQDDLTQSLRFFLLEEPKESSIKEYTGLSFKDLKKTLKDNNIFNHHFYSEQYLMNTTLNEVRNATFNLKKTDSNNKKYVLVKSRAGFGNQLFHYAAGYALSKKLNATLVLNQEKTDQNISKDTLKRQCVLDLFNIEYDVRVFHKSNNKNKFVTRINEALINMGHHFNFDIYPRVASLNDSHIHVSNENFLSLTGEEACVFLIGYTNELDEKYWYESYRLFEDYITDIQKMITLNEKTKGNIEKTLSEIKEHKNSVAVHVRRGDFLSKKNERYVMPITYYGRAMEKMAIKYPDAYFFVFTDSPDLVKPLFFNLKNCKIISDGQFTNIEEFFMMKECTHLIAGNSTFSAWVGFLKTTGDIIAPFQKRYNLNEDRSIYPPHWITLDPFVAGTI